MLYFLMCLILLVAVYCTKESQNGIKRKFWLGGMSFILALGALVALTGIGIEGASRIARKIHAIAKLM